MSLKQFIAFLLSNAIFIALASAFITHRFDKKLENYRFSKLKLQKAEIVAALLAKWGKYRGGEGEILKDAELYDYYEDLNRLSYQAILWIDDDLLNEIENAFAEGADDIRPLLRASRKYVLEKEDSSQPKKIAIWPGEQKTAERLFPHLINKSKDQAS